MPGSSDVVAHEFVEFSRQKLSELWPRICACLDSLTDEQVWWRPNENSNSIGNLLLHLNGNMRQWIVSGLGGEQDLRNRRQEFSEREHVAKSVLREKLEATIKETDTVLQSLGEKELLQRHNVQSARDVTALNVVYHVVEHFAMHYGQILYVTKMLTAQDLGFFRHLN